MKTWRMILLIACQGLLAGGAWGADGADGAATDTEGTVAAGSAGALPTRLYEVTTDTGMPHLEENLRYARKLETRCLDLRDLSGEFWMLGEVSLQDCRLVKSSESPEAAVYLLSCEGGHGTTGQATWQFGADRVTGTLDVRLGGKNMTFYQRIMARSLGVCG